MDHQSMGQSLVMDPMNNFKFYNKVKEKNHLLCMESKSNIDWTYVLSDEPTDRYGTFVVPCKINGYFNHLLADSGAWQNFVSPELVQFLKAPIYESPTEISAVVGNGEVMISPGHVILDIEAFGVYFKMRFHILEPWGQSPPIIMGWPGWKDTRLICNQMSEVPRVLSAFSP